MDNKIISNNKSNDAVLYENSKVYVTKSNSFEILNDETQILNEISKNLLINEAAIAITSK